MDVRLLQLASPALPVGAYSYSQGLESAVEAGIVHDAASAQRWIGDVLALTIATLEAPLFLRIANAWREGDAAGGARWNEEFLASREGAEPRAETLQMGHSLTLLLRELQVPGIEALEALEERAFPTAFAFAVASWRIDPVAALHAYLFAWIENQVMAAIKTVPLGQTHGQRMLRELASRIAAICERTALLGDDELQGFAPGLALACGRHEVQYSRLFRS